MRHDLEEGLARKEQGQQLALDAAVPWKDQARHTIIWLASLHELFTSEDVVNKVGLPDGEVGTNKNNAVGAAMTGAAKAGIIRRVGYVQSQRPSSHGAVIAQWEGTRP